MGIHFLGQMQIFNMGKNSLLSLSSTLPGHIWGIYHLMAIVSSHEVTIKIIQGLTAVRETCPDASRAQKGDLKLMPTDREYFSAGEVS